MVLFAFKKQKDKNLTRLISEIFHLEDSTSSHIILQLVCQVDLLLYGMAVYLVALSSVNPPTNSLSSFHVINLVISFISVTYMGPVRMKIEWIFLLVE